MSARPFPSKVKLPEGYRIADAYEVDQLGFVDIVHRVVSDCTSLVKDVIAAYKMASPVDIAFAVLALFATYIVAYIAFFVTFSEHSIFWSDYIRGVTKNDDGFDYPSEKFTFEREFTLDELWAYNGDQEGKPIYVGLKSNVYDVTSAKDLYGSGGSYSSYAGREASRAMAKLSFDVSDLDRLDLEDLSEYEIDTLNAWVKKFNVYRQYPVVGKVVAPPPPSPAVEEEGSG